MGYYSFAKVYDNLTFNVEYEKRAEYIKKILSENGCENGILLDLACGTGTLSKYLASFGYDMILADSSPEMLSFARKKLPDSLILCQSMTELDLYGTINAAVCSLDSINHLLKPLDVKKAFQKVSLFTEKGGVFVFDVNTVYKHEKILANNVFVYETDDIYCVWQNTYRQKSRTTDINLDFFVLKNGRYDRFTESFSERAYNIEDIVQWLEEAGFTVKNIYDDMTFSLPKENSQRVYISAVKL